MNAVSEVRMMSASGILGYGFPESSLKLGLERKPHMIGVDGGSSDPGPALSGLRQDVEQPPRDEARHVAAAARRDGATRSR